MGLPTGSYGDNPDQVRGPVVVRRAPGEQRWQSYFPVPRDVVEDEETADWTLLRPRAGADAARDLAEHDLAGQVSLLHGDGEPVTGWWSSAAITAYLRERDLAQPDLVDARLDHDRGGDGPWAWERRVGLARADDRTAADRMLYSTEHLRLADGAGFAALVIDPPSTEAAQFVHFGGEGRRAELRLCGAATAPALPDPPDLFEDGRLLLYLATPAVFRDGWRPSAETLGETGALVAAAVGGPEVVATARPDRTTGRVGNAALMWAVAAGSVYFLQFPGDADAGRFRDDWHGRALTQADPLLTTAGFGLALVGRW
jgi:CRISPR-associated protein (Cas_Cmr3)